ncbi:MAG TPA: hypothetical protein VFA94_01250 [Acidimicrobiales bacterium]|nr:hypothetical protein [Acidimicrobiales bacterium]
MASTTSTLATGVELIVDEQLKPGTRVEVRSRFDGRWAHGFEVAEVVDRGYRLRRLSDGSILPAEFGGEDVRKEHKRQGFWWY